MACCAWSRLDRRRLDATRCATIRVGVGSTELTLPDGRSIRFDRDRRTPWERAIYMVRTNSGLAVRRATRRGRAWEDAVAARVLPPITAAAGPGS